MEREFSGSNHLAPVTRFASAFRRRLFIEAYFRQWDEDRNLSLGFFLVENIKQAVKIINENTTSLHQTMRTLKISDSDMDRWVEEQIDFFDHIGHEEPYDPREMMYVELLQQLPEVAAKRARKTTAFIACEPGTSTYNSEIQKTVSRETEARDAIAKHDRLVSDIIQLELALSIPPSGRWTTAHEHFQEIAQYLKERRLQRIIDQLHDVVIRRIIELQSMNIARTGELFTRYSNYYSFITGYRLRTHIAHALQKRSQAIRNLVRSYNKAGAECEPPKAKLTFQEVAKYEFLGEFSLLQNSRNDITNKPWAQSVVREAIRTRQRLMRAREELVRCAVELRRLHTAITDEAVLFPRVLTRLAAELNPLYGAVKDFVDRRTRVNEHLSRRVHQAYELDGFTCVRGPGTWLGTALHHQDEASVGGSVNRTPEGPVEIEMSDGATPSIDTQVPGTAETGSIPETAVHTLEQNNAAPGRQAAATFEDADDESDIYNTPNVFDGQGDDEVHEEVDKFVEGVTAVLSEVHLG